MAVAILSAVALVLPAAISVLKNIFSTKMLL